MKITMKIRYFLLCVLVSGLLLSKEESLNADEFASQRLEMVKAQIEKIRENVN